MSFEEVQQKVCPRCYARAKAEYEAEAREVQEKYGKINPDVWAELHRRSIERQQQWKPAWTLRWKCEVQWLVTGQLFVQVHGKCTYCGWTFDHLTDVQPSIKEDHPVVDCASVERSKLGLLGRLRDLVKGSESFGSRSDERFWTVHCNFETRKDADDFYEALRELVSGTEQVSKDHQQPPG